ncbi:dihydrofolate reductase family protein [Actinacidiphila glaucinigra]|uniref:dihydrofolate reductase family protein n=1 Tax=Actinacidiphila glaucinigra TaxID=235986 RepID=UPI0033BC6323
MPPGDRQTHRGASDGPSTRHNATRIPGAEAVGRIRELRHAPRGDLVVITSPTLVCTPLGEDLVDAVLLMAMPLLLGGGESVFPEDGGLRAYELASTVTSDEGVNACTYRRAAG